MAKREKAKSPYQKYGKSPYRYSDLQGVAFQRMLVQRYGARYWIKVKADGSPIFDDQGRTIPMFPHEAYRIREAA